jgi:hypothetical protein
MNPPIVYGSVKGWRYWSVVRKKIRGKNGKFKTRFVLMADTGDEVWLSGKKTEARCRKFWCSHPRSEKGKLSIGSTCGLYAYKTKEIAHGEGFDYQGSILGRVALWGDIVPHERGFRGQNGRTLELHEGVCAVCNRFIPLPQASLIRGGFWSFISSFPRLHVGLKSILHTGLLFHLVEYIGVAMVVYGVPLLILLMNILSAENSFQLYFFLAIFCVLLILVVIVDRMVMPPFAVSKMIPSIVRYFKCFISWNRYLLICSRHIGKEQDERLLGLSARYYFKIEGSKR